MTAGDPTDDALATIASILEAPTPRREDEQPETRVGSTVPEVIEADGYSKTGPGPMASLRFRWTVRRAETNNAYYVHEIVGENSTPLVTGPMAAEAAIAFVNERESAAQRRFEQLKDEMIRRAVPAYPVQEDEGEP